MGILSELLERRSDLQIPTESRPFLGLLGFNQQSKTGLQIDADTALDASAVWSAVTQLSQAVGSLPLHLYKRLQPRGKERFHNHQCYNLLHLQPNPEMTSLVYREAMMGQVLLYGSCFSEIQRDSGDNVQALWPLLSANMELRRSNGTLSYRYQLPNGDHKTFRREQVFKVTGFSANGLLGYQPYRKMTEPIGLSLALEEYASRFFGNGGTPPAALEHPESLSVEAQDRLRENWNKTYGGLSNAHRIAILEEGMKLNVFGVTPEAAQAIESRRFMVEEVARIFNIPVHFLKELSHATYTNISHQDLEFVKYTLRPWLVRFEQEYNTQLLKPVQQNKLFFEHLIDGLLRGDAASRHDAYTKGRNWGYYSANDVREMENLNPVDGGDLYMVPLNMVPADQITNPPEPEKIPVEDLEAEAEEEVVDEVKAYWERTQEYEGVTIRKIDKAALNGIDRVVNSHKKLLTDAAQRIVNKEVAAARKAIGKGVSAFKEWMPGFYKTMPEYIRKNWKPVQMALMKSVSDEAMRIVGDTPLDDMPADLEKWADEYLDSFVKRYIDSSVGQFKWILENTPAKRAEVTDEEAFAILLRLDEMQEKRPLKISADESVRESNAVARETYASMGVTKLQWVTRGSNSCEVCKSLDGKVVGIESHFIDAGDKLFLPDAGGKPLTRGPKFHPPIHLA